jgi:hypothetical protein
MTKANATRKGRPLGKAVAAEMRLQLANAATELGPTELARQIGYSETTLARVMAGLPVYFATALATHSYLTRSHAA